MPGTAVTAGDINFTCISVDDSRRLRISRPRNMSTPDGLIGVLLLHFDNSPICEAKRDVEKVHRTSNCKRWYHLIDVPLRDGVSTSSALEEGPKIVMRAFSNLAADVANKRSASVKDRPHRVHAAQRAAGTVGVTA